MQNVALLARNDLFLTQNGGRGGVSRRLFLLSSGNSTFVRKNTVNLEVKPLQGGHQNGGRRFFGETLVGGGRSSLRRRRAHLKRTQPDVLVAGRGHRHGSAHRCHVHFRLRQPCRAANQKCMKKEVLPGGLRLQLRPWRLANADKPYLSSSYSKSRTGCWVLKIAAKQGNSVFLLSAK